MWLWSKSLVFNHRSLLLWRKKGSHYSILCCLFTQKILGSIHMVQSDTRGEKNKISCLIYYDKYPIEKQVPYGWGWGEVIKKKRGYRCCDELNPNLRCHGGVHSRDLWRKKTLSYCNIYNPKLYSTQVCINIICLDRCN